MDFRNNSRVLHRFDFTKIVLTFILDQINFQGFFVLHRATVEIFFTTKILNPENTKRKFNFVLSLFRVFVADYYIAYLK